MIPLLACLFAVANAAQLSGTVTDLGGSNLSGVGVTLVGTGQSTLTNATGEWSLGTTAVVTRPLAGTITYVRGRGVRLVLARPSMVRVEAFDQQGASLGRRPGLQLTSGPHWVMLNLPAGRLAYVMVTLNGQSQSFAVGPQSTGSLQNMGGQSSGLARQLVGAPDTLRFTWKSTVVARIPLTTVDSSGMITRIDTANTGYPAPGLLWPDGVEPGDPAVCEAPVGKRCWWVDAQASTNGDGRFASPYNDFKQVEQSLGGGDFVYVRGTFDMANHSPEHQMTLNFFKPAASGTPLAPTTLKSWRGSPRAVFSSARTDAQVRMTQNGGVRLQNIEIAHFGDVGISVDEGVGYAELVNVVARDGRVTQTTGIGGGVRFYAQDRLHTFVVRNCLFENTSDPAEAGGNVGALSLISEPTAFAGSTFKVFNSVFRNNHVAIRHKHAGQVHMEACNNLIEANNTGFHLRTWSADIHHNVLVGNVFGFFTENGNANANHQYVVRSNTLYDNDYFALASPDYDENAFYSALTLDNNIFSASSKGLGVFHLGVLDWNWGRLDRSLAQWKMNGNVFFYKPGSRQFLYSPPPTPEYTKTFSQGMAQFGDTTSILADPLFRNAPAGDFTLLPGSPAKGVGAF